MVSIKDWSKFQHFKDRKPPWIKLYRDILDDKEWHRLDAKAAKALVMLWLIASESDGALPDRETLAFRLRTTETEIDSTISKLSHWLVHDDINAISTRYQVDAPETETEKRQRERQKRADDFDIFWAAYPKKEAKKDANDAWQKVDTALESILAGVERLRRTETWLKAGGQFVPLPATFLRGRRWEDEATTTTVTVPSRIEPDPELARLRADAGRAVNVPQSVRDLTKKLTAGFTQ